MRVLVDTCVFIDYVCGREPFDAEANTLFTMGVEGNIDILLLPMSFATCMYIGKRTKSSVSHILQCFSNITPSIVLAKTSKAALKNAIEAGWSDFEDALQYHTALSHHADAIVTRNKKDFGASAIPVYTPAEFIGEMAEIID